MEQILSSIRKIVRSINLESKKMDKGQGVSIPQILCLSMLNNSPNFQAKQKEIAEKLNLNASTMSGIIDRLEKKGLLARLPKQGDRRVTLVSLTSKGSELLTEGSESLHNNLLNKLVDAPKQEVLYIEKALKLLIKYLKIEDLSESRMVDMEDKA